MLLTFILFVVVLLCVLTLRVPSCDVRYHFCIKAMFGSSLPSIVCSVGERMSYLRYLFWFSYSGV